MDTLFLNDYRCKCGKLLLKGVFFDGTAEIKCRNCGTINKIGHIKQQDDSDHYLLIISDKGIVVNASKSACDILGYPCSELVGKHFTKINTTIPNDLGEKFFGPNSVLNEDFYFQLDTNHLSKNGKVIPIAAHLKLYRPNEKERYVLLLAEIKKTDLSDISLYTGRSGKKITNKNNQEFVNEACDFYFEIDKNGIGTYLNPAMEKIFGLSPEKTIGKNYLDLLPVEIREEAEKAFVYFSTREQPFRRSNSFAIKVGNKKLYYDVYFTPNFNDTGKFVGYRVLGWLKNNP